MPDGSLTNDHGWFEMLEEIKSKSNQVYFQTTKFRRDKKKKKLQLQKS